MHPAPEGIELPLLPLPAARHLLNLHGLSMFVHATLLLLSGHWMVGALLVLLMPCTRFALRRINPRAAHAPRRLLLAADGRLYLSCVGGTTLPVTLGPGSLWLGSAVLLVLRSPQGGYRLLLGPGNLEPVALATLRRRLRGAGTAALPVAVESPVTHRQGAGAFEYFSRGFMA